MPERYQRLSPATGRVHRIASGFLQAGVPGVVGSLCSVNDLSTAHLMAKFYEFHLHGDPAMGGGPMSPARALRRAQQWLRKATAREMALADDSDPYHSASRGRDRDAYRWIRYYRAHPDERPFAHPDYWAAFAFAGA